MISKVLDFIFGTVTLTVSAGDAARAAEILVMFRFPNKGTKWTEYGAIRFTIRRSVLKSWEDAARRHNVLYEIEKRRGLPEIIHKYRKRPGIAIGVLIFALISVWSSSVIWNIDVKGNSEISDSDILMWLEELDCAPGSNISKINFDSLHNNFLIAHPDVAWISVNMDGTWAHVEVRECKDLPKSNFDGEYFNIVAGEDGQIELVCVYEGRSVVNPGDAVQKGDLVISGAMSVRDTGVRFEKGSGKVMARVTRKFTVEVPYEHTKEVLTGRSAEKKSLIFFKKRINLFLNSGIPYENYDTIENNKQIKFFGRFEIPVWISNTEYSEKSLITVNLEREEAEKIAAVDYTRALNDAIGNGELISRETQDMSDESGIKYECTIVCSDDIGVAVPITVDDSRSDELTNDLQNAQ